MLLGFQLKRKPPSQCNSDTDSATMVESAKHFSSDKAYIGLNCIKSTVIFIKAENAFLVNWEM